MLLNNIEIKILREFTKDYSRKIYGRAIAKELKLNQKTVANILNRMEKENILKFSKEGKNKYYFLNQLNSGIKEVIKIIEINKKISFLEKHKNKRSLFLELEKRTKGILIIFGSYAKNQEIKNSDLDLFVLGSIKKIDDLEDKYDIKINIIKSKKIHQEEIIFNEIIRNHIILKGVEDFLEILKW